MNESKQLMPTTTSMAFEDTKVMPTYAQLRNLNLIILAFYWLILFTGK